MLALGRETVAVARAAGVAGAATDAAEAYIADARRRLPAAGGSSTLFDLEAGPAPGARGAGGRRGGARASGSACRCP